MSCTRVEDEPARASQPPGPLQLDLLVGTASFAIEIESRNRCQGRPMDSIDVRKFRGRVSLSIRARFQL